MQITIVEVEIKEAIRNYILSQISVHEDHEIHIDLLATRGAEGYTANINIAPGRSKDADTPVKSSSNTVTISPRKAKEETKPAAKAKAADPEPSVTQEVAQPEVVEEQAQEETAAAEETTADAPTEDAGEEQAPTEAPRSIFANLKKPVNG